MPCLWAGEDAASAEVQALGALGQLQHGLDRRVLRIQGRSRHGGMVVDDGDRGGSRGSRWMLTGGGFDRECSNLEPGFFWNVPLTEYFRF